VKSLSPSTSIRETEASMGNSSPLARRPVTFPKAPMRRVVAPSCRSSPHGGVGRARMFGNELVDMLAQCLLDGDAEHLLRGRVEQDHALPGIDGNDGVHGRGNHAVETGGGCGNRPSTVLRSMIFITSFCRAIAPVASTGEDRSSAGAQEFCLINAVDKDNAPWSFPQLLAMV